MKITFFGGDYIFHSKIKKNLALALLLLFAMFIHSGCGSKNTDENIHKLVHATYYSPNSYTAKCSVYAYTKGGVSEYECDVSYDKNKDSYIVKSDNMEISMDEKRTRISRGDNSFEAPSSPDDMYIFVNTFFKSYYESENVSMSVSENSPSETTLLECDVINPTPTSSHMKLWVRSDDALPVKMQVYDKDSFMHTEIVFNEFKFQKSGE